MTESPDNTEVLGELVILVPPRPTPRARARAFRKRSKVFAVVYNPTDYKKYILSLQKEFKKQYDSDPINHACHVDIKFYYDKDSDIDNMSKAVLDAGNKILWKDDIVVTKLSLEKIPCKGQYRRTKSKLLTLQPQPEILPHIRITVTASSGLVIPLTPYRQAWNKSSKSGKVLSKKTKPQKRKSSNSKASSKM